MSSPGRSSVAPKCRVVSVPVGPVPPDPTAAFSASLILDGHVLVEDAASGDPLALQFPLAPALVSSLVSAARRIRFGRLARPGGMASQSRTSGFAARMPARGFDACRSTVLATESPAEHAVLAGAGAHLWPLLAESLPAQAADLAAWAEKIHPDWRLPGSPWTSGIINRSSQLPYHRDTNNFPTWSVMPVLRRHMGGALLHLPELGVALTAPHGYALAFPGYRVLHGVSPLIPARRFGWRYSIVYYQVSSLASCLPCAEEAAHAAAARTERERLWAAVERGDRGAAEIVAARLGLTLGEFDARRRAPEVE
jgi:hypothetical protein